MEGVLIGVMFMGILTNGMVLLDVPEFWQMFVRGLVLLAAVSFDRLTRAGSVRAKSRAAAKQTAQG